MELKYICPYWGSDNLQPKEFIEKVLSAGYNGIEMNVPDDQNFITELKLALAETGCSFVAQQWLPPKTETVDEYRARMLEYLSRLADLNPLFINAHTGKDFFSMEENCSLLESCFQFSEERAVGIVHETHRGRFNFQAAAAVSYIEKFPRLKFNADFSHFTNVSESLLEDQEHILEKLLPHVHYIHARVGSDQSAQVNHPFAPEWKTNLDRFVGWWQKIIDLAKERGDEVFYICPEFGPYPYIQQLPFTQEETANQWDVNVQMMAYLRENLKG